MQLKLQIRFQIIRDIRRPSTACANRLKFRFAQLIVNAIALFAIGAGMAAYFKGKTTLRSHEDTNSTDFSIPKFSNDSQ